MPVEIAPPPTVPAATAPLPVQAAGRTTRVPSVAIRVGRWLFAAQLFAVPTLAISNIFLGLALLAAPAAARAARVSWRRLAPLAVPLGLYVLLLLASIAGSYDVGRSLRGATEVFNLTPLLLAPLYVRGERAVRRLVAGFEILGALLAGWGLAQWAMGWGGLDQRIRGPFSHWMTYAGVLLVCDLLLLASITARRGWRSPWRWAGLMLVNLALLQSLTRSAWVALGLALTVLLLARAPKLLLAYPAAAALFVLLAPVPLLHRMTSIVDLDDISNYDRVCMAEAGLRMVADRPLFGLGPQMVERLYPIYRTPTAPRNSVPHLHNNLLQIAAERGLPALASYLALMLGSAVVAYRCYRREGGRAGPRADLYLGVMLTLLAFNVAGLFENNWGDTEVQRVVLFVLAVPFCLLAAEGPRAEAPGRAA
ncbi:MAG TPA: O-antigen ligase family protein [Thermoanaerobaculia bacterium]|nr:O-antigen ligase family protein [Thermoanaerobaculia bacterium]